MSRKNFKVDTAANGQTAKQDKSHLFVVEKTNVPTGKIKTKENREERRKAREEQYKTFRVNALRRRAKRMKLTDEQTEEKVKLLLEQLDCPNQYTVLLMFHPDNAKLLYAALDNEGIVTKMRAPAHTKEDSDALCWVDADQETLKTLREIAPPGTKIHPYVKKKANVLEDVKPKKQKKPSNNNKNVARAAKEARKAHKSYKRPNLAHMRKKERKEFIAKVKAIKASWKAQKKASGTTVPLKANKSSKSPEKASTDLKKAA